MTLRQFTSISELLNKLKADLRLSFPSFVQEFASEGISLLLESLRGVQLSQCSGPRRPRARRAAIDELGCVECLAACAERCPADTARLLAQAQPGLLALAICLTSSLNRSRVLALQLLTRVCQAPGGHAAVSEAVSTLRLRFGEGGRFRFLAGALLAPKAAPVLRLAGVSFLNAFVASASRAQTKLYIQAEVCEAGLEPRALQEWLKFADEEEPLTELLREEVHKWSRHCIDVEALQGRARRAEETCRVLSKKVTALQRQLHKMQLERRNEYNNRKQQQVQQPSTIEDKKVDHRKKEEIHKNSRVEAEKKVSSGAEDEGISFSERSSSPEDGAVVDNGDAETTIDDVIEELRTIVKDAEDELHDWKKLQQDATTANKRDTTKVITKEKSVTQQQQYQPSRARECLRNTEECARIDRDLGVVAGLKIVVPGPQHTNKDTNTNEDDDKESAIVPAIIHPQPPKRAPLCLINGTGSIFLQQHHLPVLEAAVDSEHEEDLLILDDDSDSLLSASKLNYHTPPKLFRGDGTQGDYKRRRSLSSGERKLESLADFEISETILDERISAQPPESMTIKTNYTDQHQQSNSLGSRQYSRCSNTVQRRTERRKYLRRCQSQEHVHQSRDESASVSEQIRKFESLSSCLDDERNQLRRSESFHQTSRHLAKSLDRLRRSASEDRPEHDLRYRAHGKYTSFLDNRKPSQQQRHHQEDSRLFAGRTHDVLGFGKNRFNAGKYSGNVHPQQLAARNVHRQVTNTNHLRGKVTDVVSGLY
ncbi:hypothetical protein QAD02_006248 [Eretmocerus hayati]|uniref:Uncharacterized protein n=1 Tax=Eretmocerus hayati TaxID=131215 RepID=A0ACC2N1I2_9HYME|nr:hypothetical protein QAD02_006248 [Eretmocerus hayati]